MKSRFEHGYWFAYTVGEGGEVVPFSVVRADACSRSECLRRVRQKMQREGCGGGVAGLSFEMEVKDYQAAFWCDAAPEVSDQVGQAFFRKMMSNLLPAVVQVGS